MQTTVGRLQLATSPHDVSSSTQSAVRDHQYATSSHGPLVASTSGVPVDHVLTTRDEGDEGTQYSEGSGRNLGDLAQEPEPQTSQSLLLHPRLIDLSLGPVLTSL